ncbi:MAG: sulfurtransferase TusA family protein [Nitrospirae bacterium]|nr:sulfurtransferase TusA family protein [Nitrospirota bacterium]
MADIKPDVSLDCKGLNCPMPVIKTKKALDSMSSGQILFMQATDPGTKADIAALLKRTGNELVEMKEEKGELLYYIKKTS